MSAFTKNDLNILTWEEKARLNPLYAIMTIQDFKTCDSVNFSDDELANFFRKGRIIYDYALAGILRRILAKPETTDVLEYGCGMGRILKHMVELGYHCFGVDISLTMLDHCKKFAPGVKELYLLDRNGHFDHPSNSIDFVYSYAVIQHIKKFSDYREAVAEMCRVLKPGGTILIQANCPDFENRIAGRILPWTINLEYRSIHIDFMGWNKRPWYKHPQTHWGGVYIGFEKMRSLLKKGGCTLIGAKCDLKKRRSVWFTAVKEKG